MFKDNYDYNSAALTLQLQQDQDLMGWQTKHTTQFISPASQQQTLTYTETVHQAAA